jgi:vacuolar protein sorting-associated protein VTA1
LHFRTHTFPTGNYYVLQQILNRKIHETHPEYGNYAIELMDKLESYKSENATNDAVVDDVAAQAYIENFALETFRRAEEAQNTDRVTRQTIDIFQASTTFIDLLTIWGSPDAELIAKSKFAKYHALRIAKAISKGEDPNATNPRIEPPPQIADAGTAEELAAELDADSGSTYRPPTVETAVDDDIGFVLSSAPANTEATSHAGSTRAPLVDDDYEHVPAATSTQRDDVSPIQTAQESTMGDYFPPVVAAAPSFNTSTATAPLPPPSPMISRISETQALPPTMPPTTAPSSLPATVPVTSIPQQLPTSYNFDDDSIAAAQKHAKWAISALQFEDVNTAVLELRIALKSLGGL